MKKKLLFVGGGTAGHIIPNIALINELKDKYDIYYICSDSELDKKYLDQNKIKHYELPIVKLERKLTFKNLLIPFKLFKSVNTSKKIIKKINPDLIFSKGGFVGLPVCIAGGKLNIPIILHESDYTIGLSNKLAQKYANQILTTFKETKTKYKSSTQCVGTPIRKNIKNGKAENIIGYEKLDKNKTTILVVGGSQGAEFFNSIIIDNAICLCEKYNIILITGKQNYKKIDFPKNLLRVNSVKNIEDYYKASDLVITRGGANVLFELLFISKPMLIIPLPSKNSRGDQLQNAMYFEQMGFAKVLLQNDCNNDTLTKNIEKILLNKNIYIDKMKRSKFNNATHQIINIIEKYL